MSEVVFWKLAVIRNMFTVFEGYTLKTTARGSSSSWLSDQLSKCAQHSENLVQVCKLSTLTRILC